MALSYVLPAWSAIVARVQRGDPVSGLLRNRRYTRRDGAAQLARAAPRLHTRSLSAKINKRTPRGPA